MISKRAADILIDAAAAEPEPTRLMDGVCQVSCRTLKARGLTVLLVAGRAGLTTAGSATAAGLELDTVQLDLGDGPAMTAARTGQRVSWPDIAADASRWPLVATAAHACGVVAAVSVPLLSADAPLAVLNLYCARTGQLTDAHEAELAAAVEAAGVVLLNAEAREPGGEASLRAGAARWIPIQQAAGMLSVQLAISPADATARLRAHAYVTGQPVVEVAREVLAGRLRLTL